MYAGHLHIIEMDARQLHDRDECEMYIDRILYGAWLWTTPVIMTYGRVRRCMAMCDGAWPCATVHGRVRRCMAVCAELRYQSAGRFEI